MKFVRSLMLLFVLGVFSFAEADEVYYLPASGPFYQADLGPVVARIEAGYAGGNFIGLKQGYGELGLFVSPTLANDLQPLADLRVYRLSEGEWAASAGFGVRRCCYETGRVQGANIYYDFRDGIYGGFNRVGVGLESLGRCFDFRVNGYLPVGGSANYGIVHYYDKYRGGFKYNCRETEYVFTGIDAEVGWRMYRWCDWSAYSAIGPYFYHHKEHDNIYGGQARLEVNWKRYVRLQVSVSYDDIYKTEVQGKIMLSYPFSRLFSCVYTNRCDPCRNLLDEPVRRNGVMFTDRCSDYRRNW